MWRSPAFWINVYQCAFSNQTNDRRMDVLIRCNCAQSETTPLDNGEP